jgi:hypothetical protein
MQEKDHRPLPRKKMSDQPAVPGQHSSVEGGGANAAVRDSRQNDSPDREQAQGHCRAAEGRRAGGSPAGSSSGEGAAPTWRPLRRASAPLARSLSSLLLPSKTCRSAMASFTPGAWTPGSPAGCTLVCPGYRRQCRGLLVHCPGCLRACIRIISQVLSVLPASIDSLRADNRHGRSAGPPLAFSTCCLLRCSLLFLRQAEGRLACW